MDLGWAGSGAVMLDMAVNRIWGLNCPVTGLLGGSLSQACWGGDFSDPLISSGRLVPYLFHSGKNRDIWKLHDPGKKHNLYWELLLGAPEGSLLGFYPQGEEGWRFRLRPLPADTSRIKEIHRGILDFVRFFLSTERRLDIVFPITGRDAYAPMLSVEKEKNRDFMRDLEELLDAEQVG